MAEILFIILIALISASLGCRVLALADQKLEEPVDRLAVALPLGLGLLALAALGLGELGWLNPNGLGLSMLLAALVGDWSSTYRSVRQLPSRVASAMTRE